MPELHGLGRMEPAAFAVRIAAFPDLIPPWPGLDVIPPVVIPPAPRFGETVPLAVAAQFLTETLSGAGKARLGLHRGCASYGLSRNRKMLRDAALIMECNGIAPATWVAWSIGTSQGFMDAARMGTAGWMFSPKRLNDPAVFSRFEIEQQDYCARRFTYLPAHRELVARYSAMQARLIRLPAHGDAARWVVGKFFPGDSYASGVKALRWAVSLEQARLDRMASQGAWLWG